MNDYQVFLSINTPTDQRETHVWKGHTSPLHATVCESDLTKSDLYDIHFQAWLKV